MRENIFSTCISFYLENIILIEMLEEENNNNNNNNNNNLIFLLSLYSIFLSIMIKNKIWQQKYRIPKHKNKDKNS